MHLVQILLPLTDPAGQDFPPQLYVSVRETLTHKFGGMTFHRNAPAEGLWVCDNGVAHDAIVTADVMVEDLDKDWWALYRAELEKQFNQDEIVIRALPITKL